MSLDGAVVNRLCKEINVKSAGARVDKIVQPSKDEIIIHLRWRGGNGKLLINAGADSARVQFTDSLPENPQSPPMFCMLLRKHLQPSRLVKVTQEGMDRIMFLEFEAYNDFGDAVNLKLVVEIMGRHSNIILINSEDRIIDSLKKIDFHTSSVRQVLPGLSYQLPPGQDKLNILDSSTNEVVAKILDQKSASLDKAIMNVIQGFSPLPSREIAYLVAGIHNAPVGELSRGEENELALQIASVKDLLAGDKSYPTMVLDKTGRPKDFSFLRLTQYGDAMDTREYEDYSGLLEDYFSRRDTHERIRQQSGNLNRTLKNLVQRITKRLSVQSQELEDCKNRDQLRVYGDILTANIHQLEKGQKMAKLENFYSEDNSVVEIPLDIRKTPAQNAQYYYEQYRKADNAEKMLTRLIAEGEQELEYVESVLESLGKAENSGDLDAIKQELIATGYLKKRSKKSQPKTAKSAPYEFISSDGFKIRAGRNNTQNDRLTLKDSGKEDIWLHTQKIPGSHVIIAAEGREVPENTLVEAAIIAAYHSKAQEGIKVPVDYTKIKYVKKIAGAKPGMVTYDNFKTIFANPEVNVINNLKVK